MEVVRAVTLADLPGLERLIRRATQGLTTLQLTDAQLLERVEHAVFAFHRRSESPAGEPYVLVMEDLTRGEIVGTSTLYAKTGGFEPFYAYRIDRELHQSPRIDGPGTHHRVLHLERIYDGPSEIGSLFLLRRYRGRGRGRHLSLARFALIRQRPHRFADRVIAEMRGRCSPAGVSPFWEAIMRPFFGVDFPVADAMSTVSKAFIEELIPRYPLYVDLLPDAAVEVLGKVHPETEAAVKLLESEGFTATDLVDIFDGGPVLHSPVDQIAAFRRTRLGVANIVASAATAAATAAPQILSTTAGGFRSICIPARHDPATGADPVAIDLTSQAAEALQISSGERLWVTAAHAV